MGVVMLEDLLKLFKMPNPYTDFDPTAIKVNDPLLPTKNAVWEHIFKQANPKVIVEVGSWMGASALTLASFLKDNGGAGIVICVDTWLGSWEHMTDSIPDGCFQYYKNGYPTFFYQFLANICNNNMQDVVLPMPNTSTNAARFLEGRIQADMVYIDASHFEDDVYNDCTYYWKILKPGGILVGDDWGTDWYSVICGVNKFAREKDLKIWVLDRYWLLQKVEQNI
jgi:hypothetical protein